MSNFSLPTQRVHGGSDAFGVPHFDFSSNSNACGPCPIAVEAIQHVDVSRYPDASYSALRQQLAAFHGVKVQRVVLAASASEFIFRITAVVARRGKSGGQSVWIPPHAYGDYSHAAAAHGLIAVPDPHDADLFWACEPSSPLGAAHEDWHSGNNAVRVIDRAYEPLRLSGKVTLPEPQLQRFWQLYSPNKALGLTGVRAAYAIAPLDFDTDVMTMEQLCPSWPIGAHGVAMLQAWTQRDAQAWLAASLNTLRDWKVQQLALCESLGWSVLPSHANFFVCRWDQGADTLTGLRTHGIKLRDCASFGLPDHVRLSVQPPAAQDALRAALQIYGLPLHNQTSAYIL